MASENFENLISAPLRHTKAEVTYSLVAPEAKEIGVVELPAGNPFSHPEQIINNITDISAKIATFEPNHWKLDGSFVLPLPPEKSNMEVGFWSKIMSGENGVFGNPPVIEITFPIIQNIKRFGIAFDEPTKNFCTDFQVTVYDSYDNIILDERITDNDSAYGHTQEGAIGVRRVVYKFYRTNNPYRYLRVSELDFGIVIKFIGKDIFSLNLVTEADPTGASFPLPQLSLSVNNDGRFDWLDPTSYIQFLYARQAFEYRHGVQAVEFDGNGAIAINGDVEWEYMGVYYLQDWSVSDSKVSFTCVGKSSIIENYSYLSSTLQRFTVGQLIRNILSEIGMQYYIDTILDNSPMITGWFGKEKNCREVLTCLAELSCCLCYENQQNVIEFTDIVKPLNPISNINYINMFSQPSTKLESYYNGINLKEYTLKPGTDGVQFDSEEIFYPAPWRDPNEPDLPYSVDLPCMVVTPDFPAFREWFLARKFALIRKRLSCDVSWRQNPALQVGDAASVQLNKKNGNMDMAIVCQTIDFSGGVLRGSTKTVGDSVI